MSSTCVIGLRYSPYSVPTLPRVLHRNLLASRPTAVPLTHLPAAPTGLCLAISIASWAAFLTKKCQTMSDALQVYATCSTAAQATHVGLAARCALALLFHASQVQSANQQILIKSYGLVQVALAAVFGVGAPEALVVGVVALIVFGPKGLAEVGSCIASASWRMRAWDVRICNLPNLSCIVSRPVEPGGLWSVCYKKTLDAPHTELHFLDFSCYHMGFLYTRKCGTRSQTGARLA